MSMNMTTTSPQESGGRRRRGPGRPRAGSEDKRVRILDEAVGLFGAKGYAGTSLADIANAADISKAGLLHHFPSKEDLFAKVLERRDEEDRKASPLVEGDDPWETLESWVRLLEHNFSHRDLVAVYVAMCGSVLQAGHPAHSWMAARLNSGVKLLTEAFERGKAAGLVKPEMPSNAVARIIVAASDGIQIQWTAAGTEGSTVDTSSLESDVAADFRLFTWSVMNRWGTQAAFDAHPEAVDQPTPGA